MICWIKTDDGTWINLDHATSIRPLRKNHKGGYPCIVTMAAGDTHAVNGDRCIPLNIEALTAPAFAATAGQEVVELFTTTANGNDGRPDTVTMNRLPIVGWRCVRVGVDEHCLPLLPGGDFLNDDTHYRIVLPDGRLFEPYAYGIQTLDEACAELLRDEQTRWDISHAAKAAAD